LNFYILGSKAPENVKVVATVGHGDDVAFYAVADEYDDAMNRVTAMAQTHFPGLLATKRVAIRIAKAYLCETGIPEPIFNRALKRLPGRTIGNKELPSTLAVPLEMELAPIVNYCKEGYETEQQDVLKRRNLLASAEIIALEDPDADAVFTETDGQPQWKLSASDRDTRHVPARI
jgi:hypothetical protein